MKEGWKKEEEIDREKRRKKEKGKKKERNQEWDGKIRRKREEEEFCVGSGKLWVVLSQSHCLREEERNREKENYESSIPMVKSCDFFVHSKQGKLKCLMSGPTAEILLSHFSSSLSYSFFFSLLFFRTDFHAFHRIFFLLSVINPPLANNRTLHSLFFPPSLSIFLFILSIFPLSLSTPQPYSPLIFSFSILSFFFSYPPLIFSLP